MANVQTNAIAAPLVREDPLRRELECRAALKDQFEAIILAATGAGWAADEVALALLRLAGARLNQCVASSVTRSGIRSHQKAFITERRIRHASD